LLEAQPLNFESRPFANDQKFSMPLTQALATAQTRSRCGIHNEVPSDHIGLYEKYGYVFLEMAKTKDGGDSRIYVKRL